MSLQLNKLPPHEGLGDIVLQEAEEETGDIPFYRPCLYRWTKEEIAEYEAKNDKSYFGWCVYGATPIYGVSAWIIKGSEEE
tara:strand:- start:493 stop:735 length:243 start_codon:yes stop_codon:yes gene_type:complete